MKRIALVAHDHLKQDMAEWAEFNADTIARHHLTCTGTTGRVVEEALKRGLKTLGLTYPLHLLRLNSGPLGGDQQLGALIVEGKVDMMVFFWDPMQPQPHDVDVKALLRLAVLYNIPTASNRSTADFLVSSPLFEKEYTPMRKDYSAYINRTV
jgi:methylglyoxal synthase